MSDQNVLIEGSNLTDVWLRTAQHLALPGNTRTVHLEARITGFQGSLPDEHPAARALLDAALAQNGPCESNATANLIFPRSAWIMANRRQMSASVFFSRYHDQLMKRLVKQDSRNKKGTYFDRMVAFPAKEGHVNQLQRIIDIWQSGNHRQSVLQILLYQPEIDLTAGKYMGFPCLDYISMTTGDNRLYMTAFYARQLIFERAYGNYLGLCRLGAFMAEQMGLEFSQLACHVGSADLSDKGVSKQTISSLLGSMAQSISNAPTATRKIK